MGYCFSKEKERKLLTSSTHQSDCPSLSHLQLQRIFNKWNSVVIADITHKYNIIKRYQISITFKYWLIISRQLSKIRRKKSLKQHRIKNERMLMMSHRVVCT